MTKFKKTRKHFKIDTFPKEIVEKVDEMLSDKNNTYLDVKRFLNSQGFSISLGAIGRYALNRDKILDKIMQAQEQARILSKVIKESESTDYTEAGIQIATAELTKKLAEAREDFDDLDVNDIVKLLGNLSRVKKQKTRAESEIKSKRELAYEAYEEEILSLIKGDKELETDAFKFLSKLKGRFLNNE
ncbi:phage protein Gp27 family protein [[Clostridium] colinum]|uniref:phage protein Gp27 family protein n=1 Tax=[Clostridium] colinum TaxID=36835 RepID=UPI002025A579|nr:phage protein Gp27 family protein [[Clostridium] colinum]